MGGIAAYEESRFRRHKYNAFVMRFTDQVPSQAGFGLGDAHCPARWLRFAPTCGAFSNCFERCFTGSSTPRGTKA